MANERAQPAIAPQNLEAEERVLGAMMLSDKAVERSLEVLEPDGDRKFYRRSHGHIYTAARSLHLSAKPVEPVTVIPELERLGWLEEAGGKARIHELAAIVPAAGNVKHYAELVREEWARRGVLRALEASRKTLLDGAASTDALAIAERELLGVHSTIELGRNAVFTGFEVARRFEEAVANPPAEDAGIPGPWHFCPRLMAGRVYVLAGYTAHGKTAVAIQYLRAACEAGASVGYVSLEMSADDLAERMVTAFGVGYKAAQRRIIPTHYQEPYRRALSALGGWKMTILDDPGADATAIHRYARTGGYDLLIIDHLHRFDWQERRQLEREIRAITNTARTLGVPVLLLAQLSRAHGQQPFPRPTLASLRETSIIEQEAWAVFFVWRKHDEKALPTTEAEFITAKNRSGPVVAHELRFVPHEVRYEVAA